MSSKHAPVTLASAPGDAQQSSVSVIAVGEPQEWTKEGKPMPSDGMAFIAFHEVSEAVLSLYNPEVVISPALAKGFDCIELALLLQTIGYSGAYRAVAKSIPNPKMIEQEVSRMCPNLNFKIVVAN